MRKQLKTVEEVMRALLNKETLDIVSIHSDLGTVIRNGLKDLKQFNINLFDNNYYIDTPDEYVPFDSFEDIKEIIGQGVVSKSMCWTRTIIGMDNTCNGIIIHLGNDVKINAKKLFNEWTFLDNGKPCGKIKKEEEKDTF